jgi:hypothetical protein
MLPQTQKKEVSRRIRKHTKETREHNRKVNEGYRNDISSGYNLLMKWVPGTETLIRPDILMKTVNYIKELQNKIKDVKKESLKESKKRVNYIKELENKIKEVKKESLKGVRS